MKKISTRGIVLNGIMIALVFLATYIIRIPITQGYINIGDVAIMIAAVILGKNYGFVAGAFGSSLADIAAGYLIYAPVTFIVKGVEGYIVGVIAQKAVRGIKSLALKEIIYLGGIIVGAIVMVAGYFLAEAYLLGIISKGFGLATAIADLLPNCVQGGVTAVLGYAGSVILLRSGIRKYVGVE